jgi:hypothetical protein
MSTDEENRLLKQIEMTGYPVEVDVTDYLIQKKWSVSPQYPFLDEGKLRSVDLIASPDFLGTMFDVSGSRSPLMILECKKSKNPWVFYCTRVEPFKTGFDDLRVRSRQQQFDSLLQQSRDYLRFKRNKIAPPEKLVRKIFKMHLLDGSVPMANSGHVIHAHSHEGDLDAPDDLRNAIYQLSGAYWALPRDRRNRAVFLTIVLKGQLWQFSRINGESKVSPKEHMLYNTSLIGQRGPHKHQYTSPPCIIDVVVDSYFPKYLGLLHEDMLICKELWEMQT